MKTFRECSECYLELPPNYEVCTCGARTFGAVMEVCMCPQCEHTWTRIRPDIGYLPPSPDAGVKRGTERFVALLAARGILYAAVFRLEHDKTIRPDERMRAGLKLLHAIGYVVGAAIHEGENPA